MAFPLGDILRTFVKGGWLRKVLDRLKGTKITTSGGTEILLDRDQGATPPRTGLDQPHKFGPPDLTGGLRRR